MHSLDAVAVFAQVAHHQSFSGAAKALGMPLSTVSRKVSELEMDLSITLIDRSKRQIRLTGAGNTYYELCRKGLETLNLADRVMRDRHTDTTGTITITVPPNLTEILFLKAIETFQIRHPKACVRVLVSERLLDFVDDGVDLSFRVAPPSQPDLKVRTLLRYRHRLLATPNYIATASSPKTPVELSAHRLIGFGFHERRSVNWKLSKGATTHSLQPEPILTINDYAAIKTAIQASHGIGELPEPMCVQALKSGQLIEVLPEWRFPQIKLYAVYSGRAPVTKLARMFLDTLVKEIRR
ncbi:MAG: LysR family transcriptional regulator [Thalassovita sp.]